MPMNSYQYGTSPRKYEPDYTEVKVKKVKKNIDIICSFWYDILTNRI